MQEYTVSEDESLFSEDINLLNWRGRNGGHLTSGLETERGQAGYDLLLTNPQSSRSKPEQLARETTRFRRVVKSKETVELANNKSVEKTAGCIDCTDPTKCTNAINVTTMQHRHNLCNEGNLRQSRHNLQSDILSPKILQRKYCSNRNDPRRKKNKTPSKDDSDSSTSHESNTGSLFREKSNSKREATHRKHRHHVELNKQLRVPPNKHTIPPNYHNMPKDFPDYPGYEKVHSGHRKLDGSAFRSSRTHEKQLDDDSEFNPTSKSMAQGNNLKLFQSVQTNYCTPEMCPPGKEEESELEVDLKWSSTCFITGQGPFNARLHSLGLSETLCCLCGEDDTWEHVLRDCPIHDDARCDLIKKTCRNLATHQSNNIKFPIDTLGIFESSVCFSMGFNKQEVKWEELKSPEKRELHRIIHFRICHYINPDIIIGIGDHEFSCHRLVLQSYSEYFDEFNNLESFTHIDISEKSVTKNAFIAIYSWMLSLGQGGFQHLKRDNILEVLIACQSLKIKDFENQCLAFIDDKTVFSEDNAYFLFIQASKVKEQSIMELMIPRIQAFFLTLVSSKDFLELGLEDLTTILQSNYIVVHCEQEVFMSAIRWLMHDWKGRHKHMQTVMKCVRFGLMTPSQLIEIRKNPEIPEFSEISQDKDVQKLIEDGLAYAVEKGISGGTAEHKQRCGLLGLNVPAPRNWTESTKSYKSYQDFVEFLSEIKHNPKLMYSVPTTNNESLIETILLSGSSNENLNCSENDNVRHFESREDIPSMTNILQNEKLKKIPCHKNDHALAKKELINSLKTVFSNRTAPSVQNSAHVCCVTTQTKTPQSAPSPMEEQSTVLDARTDRLSKMNSGKLTENAQYKKQSLRTNAAVVIQSAFRGYLVRKQVESIKKIIINKENSRSVVEILEKKNESESTLETTSEANREPLSPETLYFTNRESILVFGGLDPSIVLSKANNASSVFRYHPEKNMWESVDSMPEARYNHSVSLFKGRIYLAGGSDPRKEEMDEVCISDSMWSFDPKILKWFEEPRMITGRRNFGFISFHGYLYAIGGQDKDDRILSSVERYDPNIREWRVVSPLSLARAGAAVCRFNHMIWVGGGIGNSAKETILNHVECYDPKRNIWTPNTPLRFPRAFAAFFTTNSSLYLVGGAKKDKQCAVSTGAIDLWDSKKKEWKFKAEMNIPRHGHTVCYLSNQMIIIGGTSTKFMCSLNSVEAWCINRGTWIRGVSSMPVVLSGHSSITLPMLTG